MTFERQAPAADQAMSWIAAAPRWLFLGILVYVPWAYGCTPEWAVSWLVKLLAGVLGLWGVAIVVALKRPKIPWFALLIVIAILTQGWWMVANARFEFHPETVTFSSAKPILALLPGSIARSLSLGVATRLTVMLGAMLFVADFARRRIWRDRLLFTVAIVGASVAALGIVQRSSGARSIFWNGIDGETFFATFRYHSNAGAFMNLTLPVIAFQLYRACMKRSSPMIRWGWEIAYLLTFAAVIASGSRVAAALACAATVVVFGVFGQCRVWGRRKAVSSAVLFALVVGVATFSAGSRIANRWRELPGQFSSENPRLLVYGVCANMAHDAGWFGFGPGTFAAAFPYYSSPLGERASGIWLHAHNDYLQTVIEWGWASTSLFGLLLDSCLCVNGRGCVATLRVRTTRPAIG